MRFTKNKKSGRASKTFDAPEEKSEMFNGNANQPETGTPKGAAPQSNLKIEVRRIVVAESKDIAYEYSDFTLAGDQPENAPRDGYTGSMLRVWQKINGEWLIDAAFMRRNSDEENSARGANAKNKK